MNNIIEDYNELEMQIKTRDEKIKKIEELSDDVKQYIKLLNETELLNKKKKQLETKYYEVKMRKCDHVFAESLSVVYGSKIDENGCPVTDYDKYHLIFNHYCLKCGCTTDNSIILDVYHNIDPLFKDEPTSKVRHLIQTDIIDKSEDYTVIDCSDFSIRQIAEIWLNIKNNNSELSFDELLYLFNNKIKGMPKKAENKVLSKALPASVYTHLK